LIFILFIAAFYLGHAIAMEPTTNNRLVAQHSSLAVGAARALSLVCDVGLCLITAPMNLVTNVGAESLERWRAKYNAPLSYLAGDVLPKAFLNPVGLSLGLKYDPILLEQYLKWGTSANALFVGDVFEGEAFEREDMLLLDGPNQRDIFVLLIKYGLDKCHQQTIFQKSVEIYNKNYVMLILQNTAQPLRFLTNYVTSNADFLTSAAEVLSEKVIKEYNSYHATLSEQDLAAKRTAKETNLFCMVLRARLAITLFNQHFAKWSIQEDDEYWQKLYGNMILTEEEIVSIKWEINIHPLHYS
jgi:hypothetical protein